LIDNIDISGKRQASPVQLLLVKRETDRRGLGGDRCLGEHASTGAHTRPPRDYPHHFVLTYTYIISIIPIGNIKLTGESWPTKLNGKPR
jgi:hypothetical protein